MKVLVLSVRGLQAGYIGCYGNSWIATPTLDALAAQGVVFDQHFADRADAAGAWRDGRFHLADHCQPEPLAEEPADLVDRLRERGVHTCLIQDDSRPVSSRFETGWSEVERPKSFDAVLDAAAAALERLARRDALLLWVDLAPLIAPWDTPEEFLAPYFQEELTDEMDEEEDEDAEDDEEEQESLTPLSELSSVSVDPTDDVLFLRLQGSYAGAVTRLDDGIGRLLERLNAVDAKDETLVVLTADCGLALGEHGEIGTASGHPHGETTHIPLILCLPGADEAGRRVAALTQAADLAPTLADVFEVELATAQGRTLLPLVYGKAEAIRPYVCSGVKAGDEGEWSLRTPDWAFFLPVGLQTASPGTPRLHVRPDDRREVNNVVQHYMELAEGLERTLRGFVEATRRPGPFAAPELPSMEEDGASLATGD
jgi:arylsulfatase A-like enzyme